MTRSRRAARLLTALLPAVLGPAGAAAAVTDPTGLIRAGVELGCKARSGAQAASMVRLLPGAGLPERPININMQGWRADFAVDGGRLSVERLVRNGRLLRVSAQLQSDDGGRPVLLAIADGNCAIATVRRLHYDETGRPLWLEELDAVFRPTGRREPLNPPVPEHADPGGVPVALIDTGINYLLPQISRRLARDRDHRPLGYDFWDLDHRPFDAHPVRSPFFPGRHGTQTASLLLAESAVVALIPYRYPRPDMTRMAELIEDAAANGVRLVNLSLVSNDREEWLPFYDAARRHPEMLFVVAAGNHRRDIDQRPAYPAALPLENLLVVTAAETDGGLAADANWGRRTVDLMVPAVELAVTGYDGQVRLVSGSSYAAVRVTALAACLLAARPHRPTAQLRAEILGRAAAGGPDRRVAAGLLHGSALDDRGRCPTARPISGI